MSNIENSGRVQVAEKTSKIECVLSEVATANGEGQYESTARNLILSIKDQGVPREQCAGTIEKILGERWNKSKPREQFEQLADEIYAFDRPCSEEKVIPMPAAKPAARFELHDMADIQAASIPRRQWVLGHRMIQGYLSMTISPGGLGKSLLGMTDAISIATGQPLLGDEVHDPGPVWVFNTEDPLSEIKMRLAGICKHYGIDMTTLPGKVIYTSGRTSPLKLVSFISNGRTAQINDAVCRDVITEIKRLGIKALIIDPLIRTHSVSENSNTDMDLVAQALTRIAEEGECAVHAIHHTRKLNTSQGQGDMDTSRGASSVVSSARVVNTLSAMSKENASQFGISDADGLNYVILANAKLNMSPPSRDARWFKKCGEQIANKEWVGVLEPANLVAEPQRDELAEFILDRIFEEVALADADVPLSGMVKTVVSALANSESKDWGKLSESAIRRKIKNLLKRTDDLQQDRMLISLEEKTVAGKNSKNWIVATPVDQE